VPLLLLWIPGVPAGPPAAEDRHGTSGVTLAAGRRLQHPEEILEARDWLTSLDDDEIALVTPLFI
jgi:hypothetical protein